MMKPEIKCGSLFTWKFYRIKKPVHTHWQYIQFSPFCEPVIICIERAIKNFGYTIKWSFLYLESKQFPLVLICSILWTLGLQLQFSAKEIFFPVSMTLILLFLETLRKGMQIMPFIVFYRKHPYSMRHLPYSMGECVRKMEDMSGQYLLPSK